MPRVVILAEQFDCCAKGPTPAEYRLTGPKRSRFTRLRNRDHKIYPAGRALEVGIVADPPHFEWRVSTAPRALDRDVG